METENSFTRNCSYFAFDDAPHDARKSGTFDVFTENEMVTLPDYWMSGSVQRPLDDGDTFGELVKEPVPILRPNSPVNSESSWTGEDENTTLFFSIERRLWHFLLTAGQTQLTLPPLDGRQRRIVHGIAHLMHLGHKTIPSTQQLRRIKIFKKRASILTDGNSMAITDEVERPSVPSNASHSQCSIDDITPGSERLRGSNNFGTTLENAHRMPKKEGGFPCRSPDCQRTFNRSCDRKKHEKLHEPKNNHPHRCSFKQCDKTFLYPKDLRRHENVHFRKSAQVTGEEDSCPDDMSTDASASPLGKSLHGIADVDAENLLPPVPYSYNGEDELTVSAQHETWFWDDFLPNSGMNVVEDWLSHSTTWDNALEIGMQ